MAKTPILALQLADIEYQTGHRRQKSKMIFWDFLFQPLSFFIQISFTNLQLSLDPFDETSWAHEIVYHWHFMSIVTFLFVKTKLLCFNNFILVLCLQISTLDPNFILLTPWDGLILKLELLDQKFLKGGHF